MEGFRERLNRNDERDHGRGGRGRRDWDEDGRPRDGGWGGAPRGGQDDRWARQPARDDGRTPRNVPDTPSHNDPTAQRLKNQSWDSTPSSSRGGNGPLPPRPQSWDSTPRSVRGTPAPNRYGSSSSGAREWDTPRSVRASYGDESPGMAPPPSSAIDEKEWEAEQTKLDREWYNADDMGGEIEGDGFDGYDDYDKEAEAAMVAKATGQPRKRVTARQAAFNADNEAWEDNRLALSGVTGERRKLDFDSLDDDEETKVHLLVHDLKPPFLDGRLAFTKQLEPINPIKDPTSDLAVFAKKGSLLVTERRAQKEREKVRTSILPIACSSLICLPSAGRCQGRCSRRNNPR